MTHVVRGGGAVASAAAPCAVSVVRRSRADAMLQRVQSACLPPAPQRYDTISVREAILLLDRIYDTYFKVASRKNSQFIVFTKDFIKVEILDRLCKPFYEEFDKWPELTIEPLRLKTRQDNNNIDSEQKMTRRNRLRAKEPEKPKPGYCEICTTDYVDATEHQKSAQHQAFVRNHNNFLSLDELIREGGDVATFLERSTPLNGERRSLRKMCNGELDNNKKRSIRSQSPESINGGSPKANGIDEDNKRNTRRKKQAEDQPYYKVVNTTKLRSSGGFKKKTPNSCNETNPLVVKFRKIRKSELSLLSDEAEQFMFPKRGSSTSSQSSDEVKKLDKVVPSQPQPLNLERRRQARPLALKEESSEEDCWPEKRRRKRRISNGRRRTRQTRRVIKTEPVSADEDPPPEEPEPLPVGTVNETAEETNVGPIVIPDDSSIEEVGVRPAGEVESPCLKWENGRLKYAPAVEQLEFAFESVPHSEPWYETFRRQDNDEIVTRNVTKYFSLYTKSPKLPYEIGQLPPLKPNCCPLSELTKREDKAGPSRSYGTRGNKKQKRPGKKHTIATFIASESHPRKSPREHASTLAILGSAGLLQRRRHDDNKSTASEDTLHDPPLSEIQQSAKVINFFSSVFDDAGDYDIQEEMMEGEVAVVTSSNPPDVLDLVAQSENNDMIRDHLLPQMSKNSDTKKQTKTKKKNKTGWPKKRRSKKKSHNRRAPVSPAVVIKQEYDSAAEMMDAESGVEDESPLVDNQRSSTESMEIEEKDKCSLSSDDRPLRLDVKLCVQNKKGEMEERKKRKCGWLQPVVRVSRVEVPVRRSSRSRTQTLR